MEDPIHVRRKIASSRLAVGLAVLLVSLGAGTASRAAYIDDVIADGAIAYWQLGESSPGAADNAIGDPTLDGNHIGGAASASLLAGSPGNGAWSFDGAGDRIQLPTSGAINSPGPLSARTIELWFRPASLSGTQMLYEEGGAARGLNIYLEADTLYMGGWNLNNDGPDTPWGSAAVSLSGLSVGSVYHAVLVFAGNATATGTLEGFLNGSSIGSQSSLGRLYDHGDPNGIGGVEIDSYWLDPVNGPGPAPGATAWFQGQIDDVALYDTALLSGQVAAHYATGSAVPIPEPGPAHLLLLGLVGLRRLSPH